MTLRRLLSWKTLFYDALLPTIGRLGPARADSVLSALGRIVHAWPGKKRNLVCALTRAQAAFHADWEPQELASRLAATIPRYLARDYPLALFTPQQWKSQFDVEGFEHLLDTLGRGKGAIVLGCHLGAHLAGVHWLYRQDIPLRLLVQKPSHISHILRRKLEETGPHEQARLFLKRGLSSEEAVDRLIRARAALRDGLAVYLNGDIPWLGPNTQPARLMGSHHPFLSIWTNLAVLTKAPVIVVFTSFLPNGRYSIRFDQPWTIRPGEEAEAVKTYLHRLEMEIAAQPTDAVAHLLWRCYSEPLPIANPVPARIRVDEGHRETVNFKGISKVAGARQAISSQG